MSKIKIGIDEIGDIHLRVVEDRIHIDDFSNDGVIECKINKLRETIQIIEQAYRERINLDRNIFAHNRDAIQLQYYQKSIGKEIFKSNYIVIVHIPDIIKMLKSVKIEKEKYILNKDSMLGLGINDLMSLNKSMRRRKKVYTDNDGNKYIEV